MDPLINQTILKDRPIAYAITDRDLIVREISDAVRIIFTEPESDLGRALVDLVPELVGSEGALADILTGLLPRFELSWINRETAQGQMIYLNMVDLPYRDASGEIGGLIHVVEDVTEGGTLRQQLTQHRNELCLLQDRLARQNIELMAANAELRRLDEMKTMFVSVAAHELRSPLTSIKGYLAVVTNRDIGPLNKQQLEFLLIVGRSADRLLDITNSLLDVTRIETGRIALVLQPTDLGELIEAVTTEYAPQLEARAQRLALRAAPDLPPALCDETRAIQIVGNLLSNASKYTPHGGSITISLASAEEAGFLQVSVADNGVGIAPRDQDKLFSRFFRAGTAADTGASGAGLGLYITRSLVELHGGRIWFESALNQGSTFHATFPNADTLD